jgi:Dolichyl-phosphate-mannose-protein mannosyltransferase
MGHYDVPIMNNPYYGALKTWLYAPILFRARHPNAMLIREPVILIGAATIILFWCLLSRVHSRRAAWIGGILLATDTSFLLTTTFDWGPVAIQNLLLVAALFFAVHWFQTNANASLAAAGFCCGLALWDKAVFAWLFAGVWGGLVPFLPDIRPRLTLRHMAIFLGPLFLGALPLLIYNLAAVPKFGTLASNPDLHSDLKSADFWRKLKPLRSTVNGSGLFSYLVNEDSAPQPKSPRLGIERCSFAIHDIVGEHRHNHMFPALCAALAIFPLLWRTRARVVMVFSLVAMIVAWVLMASSGGGNAAHHDILLWPLLYLLIAVAFAEASLHVRLGQPALVTLVAFLVAGNVLVTNQFLYQFIRNGASTFWSDGIYRLAGRLRHSHASQILAPDWGMTDSICVLNHDTPPLRAVDESFLADTNPPTRKHDDLETLSDPNTIWLEHVPGHEAKPGVNDTIFNAARRAGFKTSMLETYLDSNGRAIFQTFRFTPQDRN